MQWDEEKFVGQREGGGLINGKGGGRDRGKGQPVSDKLKNHPLVVSAKEARSNGMR